jgi:hypothetical protein
MKPTLPSQTATIHVPDSVLEDRAADFGFDVEIASDGVILTDGERIEVFANQTAAFSFLTRLRRRS